MGECSEGIAASEGSKNNGLGSCEAHYVSVGPQENRRGTAGEVGEGEGGPEEGCLEHEQCSDEGSANRAFPFPVQ